MRLPWGEFRFSERSHLPIDDKMAAVMPLLVINATEWQERCVKAARDAKNEFTKYLDNRDSLRKHILKMDEYYKRWGHVTHTHLKYKDE